MGILTLSSNLFLVEDRFLNFGKDDTDIYFTMGQEYITITQSDGFYEFESSFAHLPKLKNKHYYSFWGRGYQPLCMAIQEISNFNGYMSLEIGNKESIVNFSTLTDVDVNSILERVLAYEK